MKLVAVHKRVAGHKKPIEPGEEFEVDAVLGEVLVARGEAKHPGAKKEEHHEPPKVEIKKETAVAPKVETREK